MWHTCMVISLYNNMKHMSGDYTKKKDSRLHFIVHFCTKTTFQCDVEQLSKDVVTT